MRTYVTTAQVINGQILVQLPADFNECVVEIRVSVSATLEKSEDSDRKVALFYQKMAEFSEFSQNTPPIPNDALRRENLYDDNGR